MRARPVAARLYSAWWISLEGEIWAATSSSRARNHRMVEQKFEHSNKKKVEAGNNVFVTLDRCLRDPESLRDYVHDDSARGFQEWRPMVRARGAQDKGWLPGVRRRNRPSHRVLVAISPRGVRLETLRGAVPIRPAHREYSERYKTRDCPRRPDAACRHPWRRRRGPRKSSSCRTGLVCGSDREETCLVFPLPRPHSGRSKSPVCCLGVEETDSTVARDGVPRPPPRNPEKLATTRPWSIACFHCGIDRDALLDSARRVAGAVCKQSGASVVRTRSAGEGRVIAFAVRETADRTPAYRRGSSWRDCQSGPDRPVSAPGFRIRFPLVRLAFAGSHFRANCGRYGAGVLLRDLYGIHAAG